MNQKTWEESRDDRIKAWRDFKKQEDLEKIRKKRILGPAPLLENSIQTPALGDSDSSVERIRYTYPDESSEKEQGVQARAPRSLLMEDMSDHSPPRAKRLR
mmetsp:Transcript_33680/g.81574  ORF Transcript_33680/g.81574 Transcript_33680/m.81574 type:complete len:101 (+) Transcript_33680:792-1094(+)